MTIAHHLASDTLARLLAAVPAGQRTDVRLAVLDRHRGGHGLRGWLALLEADCRPLHDCGRCGLPVPVRAGRRCGHEAAVDRVYFPTCPCCGGSTGRHAYWAARPGPQGVGG